MRALPFRFIGALGLTLFLGACGSPPEEKRNEDSSSIPTVAPGLPTKGDWLVQEISADPQNLNPVLGTDTTGMFLSSQILDGLLVLNNYTLKLDPCLAESYEISPDQLTYTFHLRHGVKWQDGVPFTAADVKYTFDRIQDPKVDDAPVRIYFTTIQSCEVLDPYTVRYHATERYFKTLESLGTTAVLPKHILEKAPDFNNAPFNRAPIGTGPYKFVRWDTGAQVVLERNDQYWGPPGHYLDRLVYRVIQEPYVAAQLLKKGEIDVMDPVQPLQWTREIEHSRSMQHLQESIYDYPAYYYLGFNLRLPIFSDVRVRHALDLLIPRQQIMKQLYFNKYARFTEGYDPPSAPSYNRSIPITPYDPVQAAALLKAAGWEPDPHDGFLHRNGKIFSFTVDYPAGGSGEKFLEIMQESMRHVGIDLKLQRLEFIELLAKMDDQNFEAVIGAWALDVNSDPSQIFKSDQADVKKSSNFIGYKNAAADKLMATARLEYDDGKRALIYQQLQKVIHDDYPVCFLFTPRQILLRAKRFENVQIFTPRPCYDVTTWWVPHAHQKYTPLQAP